MSIITNTFQVYQAIGVREELADYISNTSPTEVPFQTNASKGKVNNVFFEWQTDSLATAISTNQQIEGDDITSFDAVTPTVRLGNYCQISRKTLIVSETEEAVEKAGRRSERSYQIMKKGKELRRDIEKDLLENKGASAGSSSVARKTASLPAFVKTNVNMATSGTPGVSPVYTSTPTDVRTDGTQRSFTETLLKDGLQQGFTQGADFSTVMVGALAKQIFSGFAGVVELNSPQSKSGQATVIGAADTYVSDFGKLQVIANRFQRARDAWLLDWEYVEIDDLRSYKVESLAKTGDADKAMLIREYGLRITNEKGLGLIADLTP